MNTALSVALLPKLLPDHWDLQSCLAVVIDTLRFTSTASRALAAGAASIEVASRIDHAQALAATRGDNARLCGERECRPIPGFNFGNSPLEYTSELVRDRALIFSTTNGTLAVEAAEGCPIILLGALVNRAALCRAIRTFFAVEQGQRQSSGTSIRHLWIICAGTDGNVALEDVLTAGAILDGLLIENRDAALQAELKADASADNNFHLDNDAAWLALAAWRDVLKQAAELGDMREAIAQQLRRAAGGRNLIQTGFAEDVEAVAGIDTLEAVPIRRGDASCKAFQLFR